MQIGAIVSAVATGALILALSVGSNALLDRYLTTPSGVADVATAPAGAPCVDAQGKWVNWPWANVPALSPRCAEQPPLAEKNALPPAGK
jgi:hypothetical protein